MLPLLPLGECAGQCLVQRLWVGRSGRCSCPALRVSSVCHRRVAIRAVRARRAPQLVDVGRQ
eukprot:1327780-Pleurochrysis_carterae.AAC.1